MKPAQQDLAQQDLAQQDLAQQDLEPVGVEIHARNVQFDLSQTPLHWIPDYPVASNIVSGLHLLLPEGERWFCEAFTEALPYVMDDELARAMRGFIGQEAMHAETHDKAVTEFLEARGITTAPILRQAEYTFRRLLAPRLHRSERARYNDMITRLWLVAAIEHYTAILGDFSLNNRWDEHGADPVMSDVFRWHGAEEVEHRSVAHDVAQYFNPGYLLRCRAMVVAVVALSLIISRSARFVCRQDPAGDYSIPAIWIGFFRGGRRGLLPKLRSVVQATAQYFVPSFNPESIGSTAQAVAYLAASPAARAAGA